MLNLVIIDVFLLTRRNMEFYFVAIYKLADDISTGWWSIPDIYLREQTIHKNSPKREYVRDVHILCLCMYLWLTKLH